MGSEHKNVQTGHQVDKIKTCHIKNHIHAEGIRQMVVKSKKDFFFMHFDTAARVFVLSIGA